MIKNLTLILLLSITNFVFAQKVTYNLPKHIIKEKVRLTFKKVSVTSSSYHINYKAENISNGVFVIDRALTSLGVNDGYVYPISGKYVLKSGDNKTVYNQFRIKSPNKPNSDLLTLQFNGFSYANFSTPLTTEKLVLAKKATQAINQFAIKVMDYNVHSDRIFAEIKCTFNGAVNSVGNINLSNLTVKGGDVKIVKKGGIVFPGKSYTFAINITPNDEELSVDFNNVLSVGQLKNIELEDVIIKSTNYKEPVVVEVPEETEETEGNEVLELSYSDFIALKNDIKLEMDNGGKPIDMAYEFLLDKGNISTAQIIEILDVFNLDGSRLKFAKMAYSFTSDKPKYHMIVGQLAYTKNKQALEEFLENLNKQ